ATNRKLNYPAIVGIRDEDIALFIHLHPLRASQPAAQGELGAATDRNLYRPVIVAIRNEDIARGIQPHSTWATQSFGRHRGLDARKGYVLRMSLNRLRLRQQQCGGRTE